MAGVVQTMRRSTTAIPTDEASVPTAVDAFRRIIQVLRIAAKRTESEAGLSAAQLFVLQQLAIEPASSLTELGRRTMTDRSSAAAVADRLIARGLVARATSARDRRRATFEITSAGRALLRRAPEPPTALLVAALSSMPAAELTRLTQGLVSLTGLMGIASHAPHMLFENEKRSRSARGVARRPQ